MASTYIIHYFIQEGMEKAFQAHQSRLLTAARWHGGEIVAAFRPVQETPETPDEIHILRFPSPQAYDSFASDPEQASLRDQIESTLRKMAIFRSESELPYEHSLATVVSTDLKPIELPKEEPTQILENTPTYIIPSEPEAGHPAQQPQYIDTVISDTGNPAQKALSRLVLKWQKDRDKRVVFAHTYLLMTTNMMEALDQGEYHDAGWVRRLLERFASYYFNALEHYENAWFSTPPVWRVAFQVAENPQTTTAQHLLLGINAHINHDLVLTLIDMLKDEWAGLSPDQKQQRYDDHTHVNQVIAGTMEATQQEIVSRYSPILDALNKVSFHLDFIVVSQLINHWRERVWNHAAAYLDQEDRDQQHRLLQNVEYMALRRADVIMLKQGPFKMKALI